MQRMIPLDLMKRNIGLSRVNALVCLVNDKKLPFHIDKFFQFVVPTPEIQRAFQILQADKFNTICLFLHQAFCVFITGYHIRFAFQCRDFTHETEPGFSPDKLDKILIPRIGDSRTVRHNQDIAGIAAFGRL